MNLSFQEKSTWVSLVTTVVVSAIYFSKVYPILKLEPGNPVGLVKLFVGMTILYILISAVLHSVLAIHKHKEAAAGADERDKLIELKAFRNAYFALIFGLFHVGAYAFFHTSTAVIIHLALAAFVLSQIVGYITQIYHYRRGV